MNRYSGQSNVSFIGLGGQEKISQATVTILGCGALGTVAADLLARGGVGTLRIIDRDVVELSNLQRQSLFVESDAKALVPKAEAVATRLRQTNSEITIEPHIVDFTGLNALDLLRGSTLVIDATDNYRARFTLNEACLALNLPWIYGGALGMGGVMAVFGLGGPCFRCFFAELPSIGIGESCAMAGVLAPVTTIVAALQVTEALRIIIGQPHRPGMLEFDLSGGEFRPLLIEQDPSCPACRLRKREFLGQHNPQEAIAVCGQNSVMVYGQRTELDLLALEVRLKRRGYLTAGSRFRLRVEVDGGFEIVVFADGRALIYGTEELARAKSLYDNILG